MIKKVCIARTGFEPKPKPLTLPSAVRFGTGLEVSRTDCKTRCILRILCAWARTPPASVSCRPNLDVTWRDLPDMRSGIIYLRSDWTIDSRVAKLAVTVYGYKVHFRAFWLVYNAFWSLIWPYTPRKGPEMHLMAVWCHCKFCDIPFSSLDCLLEWDGESSCGHVWRC